MTRTQKRNGISGWKNNYHTGWGIQIVICFCEFGGEDLNRPVSWLVYHYVEIPLCPCHITCWDGALAADRDPRNPKSFSICSWHLRLAGTFPCHSDIFYKPSLPTKSKGFKHSTKRNYQLADTKEKGPSIFFLILFLHFCKICTIYRWSNDTKKIETVKRSIWKEFVLNLNDYFSAIKIQYETLSNIVISISTYTSRL